MDACDDFRCGENLRWRHVFCGWLPIPTKYKTLTRQNYKTEVAVWINLKRPNYKYLSCHLVGRHLTFPVTTTRYIPWVEFVFPSEIWPVIKGKEMSLILRPYVFHERLSPRSQGTVWHVGAMQAFQEKWCRCSWVGEQILFFVVLETFESFYNASTFRLPHHSSANPDFLLSQTDVSWIEARRRIDVSRASVLIRLKY